MGSGARSDAGRPTPLKPLVQLLVALAVAACGNEPVGTQTPQAGARKPGDSASPRVAVREGPLRTSPRVTLAVAPGAGWPGLTGLAVTLEGTVAADDPAAWELLVCGLPVHVDEAGRFSVVRSFPNAGTYVVSATLRHPFGWRSEDGAASPEQHVADCRVTVSTTASETERVRRLAAELVRPDGEVDAATLQELVRAHDLRAVTALWRAIDAHPQRTSPAREEAVRLIGALADLDSVPRLIRLLTDWGVHREVYAQLIGLGLWGPDVTQWQPPPSAEQEVRTVMERMLLEFAEREPELRRALHQ